MSAGKPEGELVITMLAAVVKVKDALPVVVKRGEPLPDNALPGEAKRLAGLGAIGRRKPAPVAPEDADTGGDPDAEPTGDTSTNDSTFDLEGASIEELSVHLETGKDGKPFTIPEVLDMAKADDPTVAANRARKLLEAEDHRSGKDPRDGVTAGLVKLIEADPATPSS